MIFDDEILFDVAVFIVFAGIFILVLQAVDKLINSGFLSNGEN